MKSLYNPLNFVVNAVHRDLEPRPYYPNFGMKIWVGRYGSGKTLSCVLYTLQNLIVYPDVILISNIEFKYKLKNRIYTYKTVQEMLDILILSLKNDNAKGYIIVCDEIQLVIEKMAQMGNKDLLAILSQLRKLHIEILGTCQLFNKLNKDIRDYLIQNGQIIHCTTILRSLTIQRFFDMDSIREMGTGQLAGVRTSKFKFFIHTQELYASYETNALIGQVLELLEGSNHASKLLC